MTTSTAGLQLEHVSHHYGTVRALDDVTLAVQSGTLMCLLGPSGCGKTTLLRIVAGLEQLQAGRVSIAGQVVADERGAVPPERRRVGLVFQDYALFPHLDVNGNVAFGLPRGQDRKRRVVEVLDLVGLQGFGTRMPHQLSGGQQQRVALARALAPRPSLLLLDEPFSNLDAALRARVRADVRRILEAAETTAIFVTHDQEEALSLADEIALMWNGQIVQVGTPDLLYDRPTNLDVATFLGEADVLAGSASGRIVVCELGTLPTTDPAEGDVRVMIRPEAIRLNSAPGGHGLIVGREFYGHDQLVAVRLGSGLVVRARLGPGEPLPSGERVELSVVGPVRVFAADY
jgi:iron(III) transport system ATP-binding protein